MQESSLSFSLSLFFLSLWLSHSLGCYLRLGLSNCPQGIQPRTLSNAAHASLFSPGLLVANVGVCAASPLGELPLGTIHSLVTEETKLGSALVPKAASGASTLNGSHPFCDLPLQTSCLLTISRNATSVGLQVHHSRSTWPMGPQGGLQPVLQLCKVTLTGFLSKEKSE